MFATEARWGLSEKGFRRTFAGLAMPGSWPVDFERTGMRIKYVEVSVAELLQTEIKWPAKQVLAEIARKFGETGDIRLIFLGSIHRLEKHTEILAKALAVTADEARKVRCRNAGEMQRRSDGAWVVGGTSFYLENESGSQIGMMNPILKNDLDRATLLELRELFGKEKEFRLGVLTD